jgi:uncharacterized protein RhaS with RHS repeats
MSSDFQDNLFRTYDPNTGRYLEADPIGQAAGLNLYSYALLNPISIFDEDGLNPRKTDQRYGLPDDFWDWYHRREKSKGSPDLTKEEAEHLYDKWKSEGKPSPDNKGRFRGRGRRGLAIFGVDCVTSLDCICINFPDQCPIPTDDAPPSQPECKSP